LKKRLYRSFDDVKWAEQMMQGVMRFHSLAYYRDYEEQEVRGDGNEGTSVYQPEGGLLITNQTQRTQSVQPDTSFESEVKAGEIFVYCLSKADTPRIRGAFNAVSCVEITNVPAFLRRVEKGLSAVSFGGKPGHERIGHLPRVICPGCRRTLTSRPFPLQQRPPAAAAYGDCLRRCDACRVGFSNARRRPTQIWEEPTANIPPEVRPGVTSVLENALNVRNRATKLRRFGFGTSEDAVTWTVFAYLFRSEPTALRRLGEAVFGLEPADGVEILLWGAAVDPACRRSSEVLAALVGVSNALEENECARSQPDVILDYGDSGVVVIEVKYLTGNQRAAHPRVRHYADGTPAFVDWRSAVASGLYELVRNWRIAHELAHGRPFVVVNLAPAGTLFSTPGMDSFRAAIAASSTARFMPLPWSVFLADVLRECGAWPEWFGRYVTERDLLSERLDLPDGRRGDFKDCIGARPPALRRRAADPSAGTCRFRRR
jgi:hypothetical protein